MELTILKESSSFRRFVKWITNDSALFEAENVFIVEENNKLGRQTRQDNFISTDKSGMFMTSRKKETVP